jgi:Skp family chaperone for outer membrane proteins
VKRVILTLAVAVGLTAAGTAVAQAPPAAGAAPAAAPATPTRSDPPRIAAFNVAMLMKKFDKWQYYAVTMENARIDAAIELLKMRNEIVKWQESLQGITEKAKQDQLIEQIKEKQFAFEKRERTLKDQLDADASKHLKELFTDVNQVVAGVVEANGYDIVFAYPEATTKEEAESQNYIDLKLRATAAMPFYVAKRVDITDVMIATLNKHRPMPGAMPAKKKMPDMKDMGVGTGVVPTGGPGAAPVAPVPGGNK